MRISYLVSFLFFVLTAFSANAQKSIRGKVLSQEGEAQELAAVVLFSLPDSQTVAAEYTDDKGSFEFGRVAKGNYYLKIEVLGFQSFVSANIEIADESKDLGELRLASLSEELKTVVVTSTKPLIERKADRIVFNVESSATAVGLDALELLRRTPSVSIDKDNNIKVKGKANISVYINDKASQMTGEQLTAFLKTLRSSDIEAIEVLNAAGAQYDAEGGGAVINIRLKKNKKVGWSGSVNGTFMQGFTPKGNASGSLNYRDSKINLSASLNGGLGKWRNSSYANSILNNSMFYYDRDSSTTKMADLSPRLVFDWYINPKHSVGIMLNGTLGNVNSHQTNKMQIGKIATGVVDSLLQASAQTVSNRRRLQAELNYQYVDTFGNKLFASYNELHFLNPQSNQNSNQYLNPEGTQTFSRPTFKFVTPVETTNRTGKADLEKTMGKQRQHLLKAGAKYSNSIIDNTFNVYNNSETNEVLDSARSNNFVYNEKIAGAYAEWNSSFKKLTYQAGLRYEYTNIHNTLSTYTNLQNGITKQFDYSGLFPNANVGYQFSRNHIVNLSYRRSIQRPIYQHLNPFIQRNSAVSIVSGNPNLKPAYSNNLGLSYTLFQMISIDLTYARTKNGVFNISESFYDSTLQQNFFLSTPKNVGNSQDFYLGINAPIPIAKWCEGYISTSLMYNSLKYTNSDGTPFNLGVWSGNAWGQLSFHFDKEKNWSAEVSGWFNTGGVWENWKSGMMGVMSAGLTYKFLEDKATLRLTFQDLFYTSRWFGKMNTNAMKTDASGRWEGQMAMLNFSYMFGKRSQSKRGIKTDEENRLDGNKGGMGR